MKEPIFFVFGPSRGGTTYLGSILDQWFDVGTGPEGAFVLKSIKVAKKIGDLSNLKNRFQFAKYLSQVEMLEIIRKRYPVEKSFDVTTDDILNRMTGNSIGDALFAIFKSVADYRNKSIVGNKYPGYWRYLPLLLDIFPENSYFLFISRDGRDVALSLRNVPWGGQSVYEAAVDWRKMIRSVEEFKEMIPPDRLLVLRYEDLLIRPGKEFRRIGDFLKVDNLSKLIKGFEKEACRNQKKSNFDKWKVNMSAKDIEIFEAVAGNELSLYCYETVHKSANLSKIREQFLKIQRLKRLIKLNLYGICRKLPQDKKKWQQSKIRAFFRPGAKEK